MPDKTTLAESILQELETVPWLSDGFTVKSINAGAINQNFVLTTAVQDYFVKIFSADLAVNLDREALFQLQQELYQQQLAPKPVYLSKSHDFQIDRWLSAPSLAQAKLSQGQKLQTMALLLARLHKAELNARQLDLPAQWQNYLQHIKAGQLSISKNELQQKLTDYSQIWQQADKHCFCHHDISTAHILCSQPWVLLDWEYAAYSSPWYDIASCIDVNQLSATDAQQLYLLYAENTGHEVTRIKKQCQQMLPLVKFTNMLWYAATANT